MQRFKNLRETPGQFCLEFVERGEQNRDERNPNLSEDGISARAKEGLDLQVLFDPFEEKLDQAGTSKKEDTSEPSGEALPPGGEETARDIET